MLKQERVTVPADSIETDFKVEYDYGVLVTHADRFLCVRVHPEVGPREDDHSVFSMDRHMVVSKAIDKLGHYEDICADPDWLRDLMKLWRQLCKISCHECQHMQDKTCPCPPPWGGHIRYNCPEFMKLKENY